MVQEKESVILKSSIKICVNVPRAARQHKLNDSIRWRLVFKGNVVAVQILIRGNETGREKGLFPEFEKLRSVKTCKPFNFKNLSPIIYTGMANIDCMSVAHRSKSFHPK